MLLGFFLSLWVVTGTGLEFWIEGLGIVRHPFKTKVKRNPDLEKNSDENKGGALRVVH